MNAAQSPSPTAKKAPKSAPSVPLTRRSMKKSELVALEVVRDIVRRRLAPGDPLESEAEMLARYRVARASLREALRLLENQGLITVRPGRGVSVAVGEPAAAHLARTMTLYLHLTGATYDHLLDARTLTEPLLAMLAARNPDRALVEEKLRPFVEAHGATPEELEFERGYAFHDSIAELADNPVVALPVAAIAQMEGFHIFGVSETHALHQQDVCDHGDIARAVIAGDAEEAARLMRVHCEHVAERFRVAWSHRVGERIEWR